MDSELGYDSATTPNTGQFKVHYIYMYMYNIIVKRFHRNHNHVKMSGKQSVQILCTCTVYCILADVDFLVGQLGQPSETTGTVGA